MHGLPVLIYFVKENATEKSTTVVEESDESPDIESEKYVPKPYLDKEIKETDIKEDTKLETQTTHTQEGSEVNITKYTIRVLREHVIFHCIYIYICSYIIL